MEARYSSEEYRLRGFIALVCHDAGWAEVRGELMWGRDNSLPLEADPGLDISYPSRKRPAIAMSYASIPRNPWMLSRVPESVLLLSIFMSY